MGQRKHEQPDLSFDPDKHDYYDSHRAAEILQWQQRYNWMDGQHTLRLERIYPANDENGNRTRGFLGSWRRPKSLNDIREEHGGGEYMLLIRGPSPRDPKVLDAFLGGQAFVILGPAITPRTRPEDDMKLPDPSTLPDKPPPPTQRSNALPRQEELVASGDADVVFHSEIIDVEDVIPSAPLIAAADEPDNFK